jgi:nicotinamide-nucleotide amidase
MSGTESAFSDLVAALAERGLYLATAESLTGGLLSASIVDVPGASKVFLGSTVVYTNRVKQGLLGIDADTLELHGAVSAQTAIEMAQHARTLLSDAGAVPVSSTIAISTTGVAGPDADGEHQPGEVFIALADETGEVQVEHHRFTGDRAEIRRATVLAAADMLRSLLAK